MTYVGGVVWMSIQSIISVYLATTSKKGEWKRRIAFLRCLISIGCTSLVVVGVVSALSSAMHSNTGKKKRHEISANYIV